MGVLLCINSNTILSASATNDLIVKITPVCTASEAASYSDSYVTILPGDYRVTVSVENNSIGFSGITLGISYSSYYTPVLEGIGNDVYEWISPNTYTASLKILQKSLNPSERQVLLSWIKTTTQLGDKDLVNFFLRPTGTMPTFGHILTGLNVFDIIDVDKVSIISQFNYNTSTYQRGYRFLIGEIDGDGVISAMDASYLEDVLNYYEDDIPESLLHVDALFYMMNCYGMFSDDATFCFAVGDINEDGIISMADVNAILSYVNSSVITGGIGTYIIYYGIMPY